LEYIRIVRPVPVYFDPVMLQHDTGPYHPETARRVEVVVETLRQDGHLIEAPDAPERTLMAIERVHDPAYVQRLEALCRSAPAEYEGPFALFDCPDNVISAASFEASRRAVSLTLAATDAVVAGRASAVFVAARPPGHHVLASRGMGFCFLNTIAIAARDLVEHHGLERVLVADFDVHHGNGTQELFWDDGRVAYLSVHRYPFYPGTGAASEEGAGRGRGTTRNVPLPQGAGDAAYAGGFSSALERLAERFRPEFVLVSAGFDAHGLDPIGGMRVTTEGFAWMTRALEDVAETFAGGRVVSLLEGGYHPEATAAAAVEHVRVLARTGGLI
jgi:acetoin utilization deacetylase AcuC-like enzyme